MSTSPQLLFSDGYVMMIMAVLVTGVFSALQTPGKPPGWIGEELIALATSGPCVLWTGFLCVHVCGTSHRLHKGTFSLEQCFMWFLVSNSFNLI